jgi:23S rRNA G2445 N2-methylase RlmL
LKTVAALRRKSTKQYIVQVTANDVDKNAIAAAKVNAEHAGIQQYIAFTEGA